LDYGQKKSRPSRKFSTLSVIKATQTDERSEEAEVERDDVVKEEEIDDEHADDIGVLQDEFSVPFHAQNGAAADCEYPSGRMLLSCLELDDWEVGIKRSCV
jgi:hypothetical protein